MKHESFRGTGKREGRVESEVTERKAECDEQSAREAVSTALISAASRPLPVDGTLPQVCRSSAEGLPAPFADR